MRWFIIVAVALLALILAIFAAGAVLPRKHVSTLTTSINQPAQVIWQVIADHANDPQWRPDLKTIQRLPDRNGHPVWLETYKNDMKLELEDTVAEPPNKLVRQVRDAGNVFNGRWEIEITPKGTDSSTIRITEYGEVPNPFFRFMSHFVFGHTKSMEQYLTNLHKRFGESPLVSMSAQ